MQIPNLIPFFALCQDEYFFEPPENITLGYMIAQPIIKRELKGNPPKRICFVYTYFNDTYAWTVDTTTCPRNIKPGSTSWGKFRFNSTKLGEITLFSIHDVSDQYHQILQSPAGPRGLSSP